MRNRLFKPRPHSNHRPGFSIHLDSSEGGMYLPVPTAICAEIPSQLLKQPPPLRTLQTGPPVAARIPTNA